MLQIIYGDVGTGKTTELYRRIQEHIEDGTQAYILVPEQFSMETERSVIKRLGISAQKNVEVLTFSRLCNLVLSQMGPLRMQYINSAGKLLLVRRALQKCEKELRAFNANIYQRGFADVIVSVVSECKRYGVSADRLKEASEKTSRPELKDKLCDLALLYETYQKLLSEHMADAEDNLSLILPKLSHCDFLSGSLYIQHFKSFTPVEMSAVTELMKLLDVIFIAECEDIYAETGVMSSAAETARQLCSAADANGVERSEHIRFTEEVKYKDNPALLHLKQNFFSPDPIPYDEEQDSLCICMPQNPDGEVTVCAQTILRLCRENGYKMNDFLILTRTPESYVPLIRSVFRLYNIPVFIDCKHSIAQNPLIRFTSGLFDCLSYGLSLERVMTMARTDLFNLTRDEIDIFENYVLATGINHAMWNNETDWTYNPDKYQFDMESINRIRDVLLYPVRETASACRGRKTANDICAALISCMEKMGLSERFSDIISDLLSDGNTEKAEEYRQVWNTNLSLIALINDTFGEDSSTFLKFGELYNSLCQATEVGSVPTAIDQVTVSEISRFRNSDAKVVFVLGVTEGCFPKSVVQEGILSDRDRDELKSFDIELAPSLFVKAMEEQDLVYRVLTAPKDKLYICAPTSNKEGAAIFPSEIITKIRETLFPNIKIITEQERSVNRLEGRLPVLDELVSKISECGGNENNLSPAWQGIYKYFSEQEDTAPVINRMTELYKQGQINEMLSLEQVKTLYGDPIRLSVTRLEKYNECAFAFFMRYGLYINPRMEAGFAANSMGSVLHDVLSEYFGEITRNGTEYANISKEECIKEVERLTALSAQNKEEVLFNSSYYYKYMVMRMQGIASATAWEIVKFYRQSKFRPIGFEINIDDGGTVPPIKIKTQKGGAVLKGFIDRADMAEINGEKYISILDYKSSDKDMDDELAAAGVRIQPLIYSKAMCDSTENSHPAAVLYMKMNDPIVEFSNTPSEDELDSARHNEITIKGWILGDEDVTAAFESGESADKFAPCSKNSVLEKELFEGKIDAAYQKITESADEIFDGNITAKPYNGKYSACEYCDYKGLCKRKD